MSCKTAFKTEIRTPKHSGKMLDILTIIKYQDDYLDQWDNPNGSQFERSLLTIGTENDPSNIAHIDNIALMPSGNVGIGTTSPGKKLHVAGQGQIDDLQINSFNIL